MASWKNIWGYPPTRTSILTVPFVATDSENNNIMQQSNHHRRELVRSGRGNWFMQTKLAKYLTTKPRQQKETVNNPFATSIRKHSSLSESARDEVTEGQLSDVQWKSITKVTKSSPCTKFFHCKKRKLSMKKYSTITENAFCKANNSGSWSPTFCSLTSSVNSRLLRKLRPPKTKT